MTSLASFASAFVPLKITARISAGGSTCKAETRCCALLSRIDQSFSSGLDAACLHDTRARILLGRLPRFAKNSDTKGIFNLTLTATSGSLSHQTAVGVTVKDQQHTRQEGTITELPRQK